MAGVSAYTDWTSRSPRERYTQSREVLKRSASTTPNIARAMQARWQPDMVVGVDFGMTCSGMQRICFLYLSLKPVVGVAWSSGPEWPDPKTIQRWPGKLGHELRNKVDTSGTSLVKASLAPCASSNPSAPSSVVRHTYRSHD